MEGAWSCYRGGHFNGGKMVVTELVSVGRENGYELARIGQFNGRENGHVTEVDSLMEGEWSCYGGGQFKAGRMVMLQRRPVQWRENGHVTEVASLMDGEWSC